jgi:transcriptional regulator of arginine metabolism
MYLDIMKIVTELNKMLSQGISGNQTQLVEFLKQQGIKTTQSTVCRALKKINAVKGIDENANTIYSLPKIKQGIKGVFVFESLVNKILDNKNLIVIHTRPGTANTVAKFLDDKGFDEIIGTVAGDDTIMIVPLDVNKTTRVAQKIGSFLKEIGVFF